MVRYAVFFVLSSLIVFSITLYFRLGGHKSVAIERAELTAYQVIGKKHIGAYHKINAVIVEVESWAKANNVPCQRTFGEYLDDPRQKAEDRLESIGGCVLGTITEDNNPLKGKTLPEEFELRTIAAGPRIVATFTGAPSIGPFKVYPAVEDYMRQNGLKTSGPVIEIYEFHGDQARTEYQFPFSAAN